MNQMIKTQSKEIKTMACYCQELTSQNRKNCNAQRGKNNAAIQNSSNFFFIIGHFHVL